MREPFLALGFWPDLGVVAEKAASMDPPAERNCRRFGPRFFFMPLSKSRSPARKPPGGRDAGCVASIPAFYKISPRFEAGISEARDVASCRGLGIALASGVGASNKAKLDLTNPRPLSRLSIPKVLTETAQLDGWLLRLAIGGHWQHRYRQLIKDNP